MRLGGESKRGDIAGK